MPPGLGVVPRVPVMPVVPVVPVPSIVRVAGEFMVPAAGESMVPMLPRLLGIVESIGAPWVEGDIGCCTPVFDGVVAGVVVCAYARPMAPNTDAAVTVATTSFVAFIRYS
jgi:hypothetical protein